jgi:hypothetical protein
MNRETVDYFFEKLWRFLGLITRPVSDAAVDLKDPIGGAVKDAELLIAFAAQSFRKISRDKVKNLTDISVKIDSSLKKKEPISADDRTGFWIAYDDFAVEIAPLSAHSIRTSLNINSKKFPTSLFTPTAIMSFVTVVVFLVCLGLQGFWVAGVELINRADMLEAQKLDVQKKIAINRSALQRARFRAENVEVRRCLLGLNCQNTDGLGGERNSADLKKMHAPKVDAAIEAELNAEEKLAKTELTEKNLIARELFDEESKIIQRSRPLENLLLDWHERSQRVCGIKYLSIFCPVDHLREKMASEDLQKKIEIAQNEVEKEKLIKQKEQIRKTNEQSENGDRQTEKRTDKLALSFMAANRVSENKQKLEYLQQEKRQQQADELPRITVEIRLVVANIGTYLIAMAMGILGALTFILRTLSQQLRDHTYVPVSTSISIIRICLGAIAGVFGSLFVPGADASLKSLPPLFIPFVFGYGIEILFSLLDRVVRTFTQPEQKSG